MALLNKVKTALGISHTAWDDKLGTDILAAEQEITMAGGIVSEDDPYIEQAVIFYCKHANNYQGKGETYAELFEKQKARIALFAGENR